MIRRAAFLLCLGSLLAPRADATVAVAPIFGNSMVLQRGKPVPVYGTASPGEKVSVAFNGQSLPAAPDAQGNWQVLLPAMAANAKGQSLTVTGSNTVTLTDVLVGDVWLCSGQSNMDWNLAGCKRDQDVASADFPGIRHLTVPLAFQGTPAKTFNGKVNWNVCSPGTAKDFSAVAFYFARKVYQETKGAIPIGLIKSACGGTTIDLWLPPDGCSDIPALQPLFSQSPMPNGPFSLFNGMIHPVAPFAIKGVLWYQGENAEKSVQSKDSYFLKMKALQQGLKRVWGSEDLAFYYVMIAYWGKKPESSAPMLNTGGWDADTRLQQVNALALPHAGCASALDVGDSSMGDKVWDGWHPKDKLDVGERLALWALKNDYGQPATMACGPVLKSVALAGNSVVCSFDHVGSGLMAGAKEWYVPTKEIPGGKLDLFVIAGADGKWFPATATLKANQVVLSSPSVAEPRKISYACWQNPVGANLYNKEGLPAAPFHVEDVTKSFTITASAGPGGEISFPGKNSLLPRATALYEIKPKGGYFVGDVKVDGVSIGSPGSFTFDPIAADHSIEAVFTQSPPKYSINASANGGGAIQPVGTVAAVQGGSNRFVITPQPGVLIKSLTVDGVTLGGRDRYSFTDVRQNHTLAAAFACQIDAAAGFGGSVSPSSEVVVNYGESATFKIAPIEGYAIAQVLVDGKDVGPVATYTFPKLAAAHTLTARFKAKSAAAGSIPKPDQLIFAALAESLPAGGATGPWPAYFPKDKSFPPMGGAPASVKIDGHDYRRHVAVKGGGFNVGSFSEPIACTGASIVVVARPLRNGSNSGWTALVDVFFDRLVLGIRNDSGLVCVRRNGPIDNSSVAIADGQITILSLIVQPDGTYKVYANGAEIMANSKPSDLSSLVPGGAGAIAKNITIGRNTPDVWTAFNGDIGDVFLYKTALSEPERKELEAHLAHKLAAP